MDRISVWTGNQLKMHTVVYYAVLIQRTEFIQNFDIISDIFPSRISSYPVFKGAKTK